MKTFCLKLVLLFLIIALLSGCGADYDSRSSSVELFEGIVPGISVDDAISELEDYKNHHCWVIEDNDDSRYWVECLGSEFETFGLKYKSFSMFYDSNRIITGISSYIDLKDKSQDSINKLKDKTLEKIKKVARFEGTETKSNMEYNDFSISLNGKTYKLTFAAYNGVPNSSDSSKFYLVLEK